LKLELVTTPRGDVVVATSPRPAAAAVKLVTALSLPMTMPTPMVIPEASPSMRVVRKPNAS